MEAFRTRLLESLTQFRIMPAYQLVTYKRAAISYFVIQTAGAAQGLPALEARPIVSGGPGRL